METRARRRRQGPTCLLDLSPELLGRILSALPDGKMKNVRLACRALDDASRKLAHCAATLELKLWRMSKAAKSAPLPRLGRFSAARWLVIESCSSPEDGSLLAATLAAAGAGALGSVKEVDASDCSQLSAAAWSAIMRAAPNAAVARLPDSTREGDLDNTHEVLAVVTSGAPKLAELRAPACDLDASGAALLASAAPRLRSLQVSKLSGGDPVAAAWAALRCRFRRGSRYPLQS